MATNNALNIRSDYPSFMVYLNSDQLNATGSGNSAINFDTIVYDTANSFSLSTHRYTVPVAGIYIINFGVCINGMSAGHSTSYSMYLSRTFNKTNPYVSQSSSGNMDYTGLITAELDYESQIASYINVSGSTQTVNILGGKQRTWLSGCCIVVF